MLIESTHISYSLYDSLYDTQTFSIWYKDSQFQHYQKWSKDALSLLPTLNMAQNYIINSFMS